MLDPTGAELRSILRLGMRGLLVAGGYLIIVILLLRYVPSDGRRFGQWLVAGSLALMALPNAGTAATIALQLRGVRVDYGVWLQLAGVIGLMLLAIALLVWLQERTQATSESRSLKADRLAHFDEPSGLPNRQGLLRRVEGEVAAAAPLAILTLRIHRYALLERTLGSAWVEAAVRTLAASLAGGRRFHLLALGRIDSDRLAVALAADGTLADAEVMARRRDAEHAVIGLGHPITMSFGYAVRALRETPATLLASACAAQEKGEAAGVRMVQFEPELARSDADEVDRVGALYRALGDDQLFLEFQGIFDLETGALDSVEALIRWQHPVEGRLAPGDFLPAAERAGLMGDIDAWVIETVCRTLRQRQEAALLVVPVAVNLSAASLLDLGLAARIESALRRNALRPGLLEMEVTESAAMTDIGVASRTVDEIRKLGVRIALDDLGTGYSSLSHLRELRPDRLKVDRSFVADSDRFGHAIVAAIGALGRSLGADVVAEGVETAEQLERCRQHRIGKVQGWLLHRPSVQWPQALPAAPV